MPALPSQAQTFDYIRIDYEDVRTTVSTAGSPFYYPLLFERYTSRDTTLGIEEYRYLYYGFTFQKEYQPYRKTDSEEQISQLLSTDTILGEDFSAILNLSMEILQWHPFSLRYLLTSAVACSQLGYADEAGGYYHQYNQVLSAILSTGDGATEQSAWSVILVSDEYELTGALGFQVTGQQKFLNQSLCDFLYVKPNEYTIEGFYFDISRPFSAGF
jgi:hypothetical protein